MERSREKEKAAEVRYGLTVVVGRGTVLLQHRRLPAPTTRYGYVDPAQLFKPDISASLFFTLHSSSYRQMCIYSTQVSHPVLLLLT